MTLQRLQDGSISPLWVKERQGRLGGSTIAKIMPASKTDSPLSQGALTLARQLALERFYGHSFNNVDPNNEDIMRGNEMESVAIAAYEIAKGMMLSPARWVDHPTIENAGATPDSFTPDGGLVQVKAPRREKYGMIVSAGAFPKEYVDQMQWEMAVTRREWNDLALYCAEFPEGQRLWVRRLHADPKRIEQLEEKARIFLAEVEAIFEALPSIKFIEEV